MRKIIKTRIRQILTALCTVLGIGTLTSCYGCPPGDFVDYVGGQVFAPDTDQNYSNGGISGIQVTLLYNSQELVKTTSGEYGWYSYGNIDPRYYTLPVTLQFDDIDGAVNGSFNSKTVALTSIYDESEKQYVTLDPKTE